MRAVEKIKCLVGRVSCMHVSRAQRHERRLIDKKENSGFEKKKKKYADRKK